MSASLAVQRLAALSGALAVSACAHGAHVFKESSKDDYQREVCILTALPHSHYLSFLPQFGSFRSLSMQEACSGWSNSPDRHGLLLWSSLPPGING
ncbi:uncharacterized protein Hap1MRO34_007967 isoform 2-T2 [Clarias gariepinus]